MNIVNRFLNQWRKPTGRLGRLIAWVLNISHSKGMLWGLQHITPETNFSILDVGCGGGKFVHELAGIVTEGKVYGIDYSEACVAVPQRTNRRWIKMGRTQILCGSVSAIPFPDRMFDLVTAVNSHYYWPDLIQDMREVLRGLKSGGRLVLIGESYKGGKYEKRDRKFIKLVNLAYYSVNEPRELFSSAGFSDVQIHEAYERGWICGIGEKPL